MGSKARFATLLAASAALALWCSAASDEGRKLTLVAIAGLFFAIVTLPPLWNRFQTRRLLREQLAEWKAIAEPLGFRAELGKDVVTLRGLVGSRPFEVDHRNFITYGLDTQLGMRVEVEDDGTRL